MAVHYEVSVDIDAAPADVWAIVRDVERWPTWTDTMTSVRRLDEGELRVGSKARVKQPRIPAATWQVTDLQPGSSFTWESRSPGMRSVGGHRIVAAGGGSSVTLSIDQSGPLAALARPVTAGLIRRYVRIEADSLKHRCEDQAGTRLGQG